LLSARPNGSPILQLNRLDDAEAALKSALALAPDEEWFHRLDAAIKEQQCDFPEALDAVDEALRLAPEEPQGHHLRSVILNSMRRRSDAREAAERAVSLAPHESAFHRQLGNLWLEDDPVCAETHYRAALRIDPNNPAALNNLGVALNKQKRTREAAIAFKSALLLNPTMSEARRNTHSTVQQLLGVGGPMVAGAGYFLLKVGVLSAVHGGVAMCAVILLAFGGVRLWRKQSSEECVRDLAAQDPQLYEIYEKLDRDKKKRRL
jgi:tetratricopeptide (TPR) repeat protein